MACVRMGLSLRRQHWLLQAAKPHAKGKAAWAKHVQKIASLLAMHQPHRGEDPNDISGVESLLKNYFMLVGPCSMTCHSSKRALAAAASRCMQTSWFLGMCMFGWADTEVLADIECAHKHTLHGHCSLPGGGRHQAMCWLQVDFLLSRLQSLEERIDGCEDQLNIELDHR